MPIGLIGWCEAFGSDHFGFVFSVVSEEGTRLGRVSLSLSATVDTLTVAASL
jgi:hypothetical protein